MPFLTISYKRLHYTDYPPASDATKYRGTVICHHGLGSSQNFYAPIAPQLTAAGFRVITFDVTGAARSPYTQVEQSVASLADDVVGILDALAVDKAIVMGHSMGGMVASHLASEGTSKKRIHAVVLIGPVYPSEGVAKVFEKRIEIVEKEGMEPMADTIPYGAVGSAAGPLVSPFIRELLLGQNSAGYLSNCRVIANAKRPVYEDIKCPVLLLAGQEDKSAPLDQCRKMFEEIGSERKHLEVLEGVGHWHCIEAPIVVGEHILGFLSSNKS
ncbi:Putative aminoacrylate hydrolase RutD [Cytospora mali]|uniref:Aminoacrylate hydrolase RutD n=1 Tax=Cytospora mali TaxID=578113 RepID=A0A194VKB7_CYTMA|nr:Putative aminoacrylate hydrolase RutD [Valsa mali]